MKMQLKTTSFWMKKYPCKINNLQGYGQNNPSKMRVLEGYFLGVETPDPLFACDAP
jgi:hypothetical protein